MATVTVTPTNWLAAIVIVCQAASFVAVGVLGAPDCDAFRKKARRTAAILGRRALRHRMAAAELGFVVEVSAKADATMRATYRIEPIFRLARR